MNHENAVRLIEELHHGTLVGQVRNDLLTHLDDCRECRALSDTYSTIGDAYIVEGDHPSSASMAQYAVNPAGLDRDERDRIASHLNRCVTCRLELDVTREAEAEISRAQAARSESADDRSPASLSSFRSGLAAAILVAALGYPAYLGLFQLPRIKEKLARFESIPPSPASSAESWSGNVQMVVLSSPLRSEESLVPALEVGDDPYVVLAVDLSASGDRYRGQATHIAIRDADGQSVWSKELSAASVGRNVEATGGAVTVLVPAAILRPGRLTTSITQDTGSGEEQLFQADFRVVPASGGATSSSPRR